MAHALRDHTGNDSATHSARGGVAMTTTSALAPHHLTMLIQESGITAEVIAERGYRSIDGASGYTELKALGFSKPQATSLSGLLLPLHTTDGKQPLTIYRPDQPQPDANGRLRKYLLPKGASVRL